MLILNPRKVTFDGQAWPDVTLLSLDRSTTRLALNWGDAGPHPTFADAPEQRVDVRVVMELGENSLDSPRPGGSGDLVFTTSVNASDAQRRRITIPCVVVAVSQQLSAKGTATRTVELVAVSSDGSTDPVTITSEG